MRFVFPLLGVVGIGQDITDARAKRDAEMKQRAAEAATAAQATISAHVYHEIRNVVGSVLALADRATEAVDLALIEEDDEIGLRELPTRVRELTDHQRLVCQHAVDTLNDMLDVSFVSLTIAVNIALDCILTAMSYKILAYTLPLMKNDVP